MSILQKAAESVNKRHRAIPADYERTIRRAAQRLLVRAGAAEPPIDVRRLAELQGVLDIREADLGSTDAQLTQVDGGYLIEVNRYGSPRRKRFSIAHEIAHTFFKPRVRAFRHTTGTVTITKEKPSDVVEEILCDIAASELLMPREQFISSSRALPVSIDTVERLSDQFDTSIEATALRYGTVNGEKFQMVVWSRRHSGLTPKWSIGERVVSPSAFAVRNPTNSVQWSVARALLTDERVQANDPDLSAYPPRRVWVEAKAFRRGPGRYVLTILRSAFSEGR